MMLIGWVFSFLVVNAVFALLGVYLSGLNPLLRSAVKTTILVPAFGLGLPVIQRKPYRWTIK
ncbi:hypothetical protein ACFP1I_08595 [Dyadobacter subterraneus]|uniref:Uncharacterized protein n=1 Tax=Dyadobacter subterraneus TaxID=2773304 RepID=A0ABR9WI20_9BACT|nr:hypothetical protein [Dyadobacter subterraneus]MBE9463804.1 hypothetical protein [Dyadobacter subterraneus]